MANTTSGYAPVNGIDMYYELHGSGSPLVLVHGGGSTITTSFSKILPLLAKHRQVIAVELQAHGHTSDRDAPESFQQDADDVAALLQQLHIAKADILGFSNGGSTAMQVAIRHPQLVNKLIIISAAYKRDGFFPGFFDMMNKGTLQDMPMPLRQAYLDIPHTQAELQNMFEKDCNRMIGFTDWDDADIRAINAPALIINGDKDVTTTEHALAMHRLMPNSRLVILPGFHGDCIGESLSQATNKELPAITVSLMEDFLDN